MAFTLEIKNCPWTNQLPHLVLFFFNYLQEKVLRACIYFPLHFVSLYLKSYIFKGRKKKLAGFIHWLHNDVRRKGASQDFSVCLNYAKKEVHGRMSH